jgi:tetratricopeptide (TPR) repeat protein
LRELFPDEYAAFGRAYLTLNDPDKSKELIYRAHEHYPDDGKIMYELALALSESGDEEGAYNVLKAYFQKNSANYTQIKNLAALAYSTGRIKEAIQLLQKALSRTRDAKERGELHCHLFELKRMDGRSPNELLRHVHEFGKAVGQDDNLEARYLSMAQLATLKYTADDAETNEWLAEAGERFRLFTERNPKNPIFKILKLDMTVPESDRGMDIRSSIVAEMLPHSILAAKLRIAQRSGAYPFIFKYKYGGSGSIFEYWSSVTQSKDAEDRLHIWDADNNLDKENNVATTSKKVCIDISALLTLAGCNLLDILQEFELIIIASGTKRLINAEHAAILPPHGLAIKLEKWRLENKRKIRVRTSEGQEHELMDAGIDAFRQIAESGLLVKRDVSLQEIVGSGMGETVLIAQELSSFIFR